MKKYFTNIFLLASLISMGQAIKFGKLGGGFNLNPVRSLFYDTIDKKLYAGGNFKFAEGKTVSGIAVWNGNVWDSLKGGLTQYPQDPNEGPFNNGFAHKMVRFQNKIYVVGGFDWVDGKSQTNLGIWNGASWDYPIAQPPNGQVFDLLVHNNALYACGMFTKFGNTTCNYVAKFDGNSWQPVGDITKYCKTFSPPALMQAIEVYSNEIYVGGAWDDSTGTTRNIAKFDGIKWQNVGTGIQQGGVNAIFTLETFKNELYIGGRFSRTPQIPGRSIIKWDGNSYRSVGYDILSDGCPVFQLKASKSHLFAIGNFYNIGETKSYNLFYMDSFSACHVSYIDSAMYASNGGFSCCEVINDSLIVAGLFVKLDTITANSVGVIKDFESNSDCSYVGIKNVLMEDNFIKVYPNPIKNILNVELSTSDIQNIRLIINKCVRSNIFSFGSAGSATRD